ncbi:hypothetical protein RFI_25706 [Reticulomyxa filosa]|uniref:Uncharacterized protein n=1 Tax=Reticulomyxa filosa TaxID=46433 RepID=X6MF47_RETFI|nr:hypothetical protein RFI_25706 [Reticulomyxa filosa]|eukprot:ETO11670.1 hypothetical protein RFI_25706 [Reticulomyxa filosa]
MKRREKSMVILIVVLIYVKVHVGVLSVSVDIEDILLYDQFFIYTLNHRVESSLLKLNLIIKCIKQAVETKIIQLWCIIQIQILKLKQTKYINVKIKSNFLSISLKPLISFGNLDL